MATGRKGSELGRVQNALFTLCSLFLNWPFLGVKKLFGREIPPCWGQLHVGTPTVCQSWGGNGSEDLTGIFFRICIIVMVSVSQQWR